MTQHIKSLTSLRGVAALFVVMHHSFGYLLPGLGLTVSLYTKFFSNGYLWVDFFFIMSGFIMTHVYANNFSLGVNSYSYRAYLFSRLARIYPLHLFMLFLFVGVELAKTSSPFTGKYSITTLFTNIFLFQAIDLSSPPLFGRMTYWNEPSWSISAEWIAYLILPFLLLFFSKIKNIFAVIVYIFALISLFILIKLTYGHLDFLGLPSIARCTLECILGIITYNLYQSSYAKHFRRSSALIISLLWIGIVMHYDWNDILIIPAFSLLILSASVNKNTSFILKALNSNSLVFLGFRSYSIYMVHWFIQEFIKLAWWKIFQAEFGSNLNAYYSFIVLLLFIVIVVVAASLTYRFIEIPMRTRLKRGEYFYVKF